MHPALQRGTQSMGFFIQPSTSSHHTQAKIKYAHPTAVGGFALTLLLQKEEGRGSKVHLPSRCFKI
jgi:hypothetical protein